MGYLILHMPRYQEIKEKIELGYRTLPKNQKRIADHFLDNFDRIPFLNVHDLSETTGASVASVVRFAQRVGFKGFSDMRDAIGESLQNQISRKEIFPLVDKTRFNDDLLTSVANLDIKNINDTLAIIDRESFDKTIDLIMRSTRIFTGGLGISYLLAEILAYQLSQVGLDAAVLKHTHVSFNEQVLFFSPKDMLIVFSFPPYSKETIEAARCANEKKIKVISITNKPASPVTFYSYTSLIVKSENMLFTNSFAAISVLINAMATACALKNKSKAKKFLKESMDIMENQHLLIE